VRLSVGRHESRLISDLPVWRRSGCAGALWHCHGQLVRGPRRHSAIWLTLPLSEPGPGPPLNAAVRAGCHRGWQVRSGQVSASPAGRGGCRLPVARARRGRVTLRLAACASSAGRGRSGLGAGMGCQWGSEPARRTLRLAQHGGGTSQGQHSEVRRAQAAECHWPSGTPSLLSLVALSSDVATCHQIRRQLPARHMHPACISQRACSLRAAQSAQIGRQWPLRARVTCYAASGRA
jgi:hypothetical protein